MKRWMRSELESHAALAFLAFLLWQPSLFPRYENYLDWYFCVGLILCYLPFHYLRGRTEIQRVLIAVCIVLIGASSLVFDLNYLGSVFFVYAADAAARQRRTRDAWLATAVILVCMVASALGADAEYRLVALTGSFAAFLPMGVVVAARIKETKRTETAAQLEKHQSQLLYAATAAERERISRDLHDSLGQTLALITLKSELAAKLIPQDSKNASREIADVIEVSRNATRELREVVQGTRRWSIRSEVNAGGQVLESAGIEFESFVGELEQMNPTVEDALALVVREGITNVVRHSSASRVNLRIVPSTEDSWIELTLSDNGQDGKISSGLDGLRERVQQLGGTLEIRSAADGVTLTTVMPAEPTDSNDQPAKQLR